MRLFMPVFMVVAITAPVTRITNYLEVDKDLQFQILVVNFGVVMLASGYYLYNVLTWKGPRF